MSVVPWKGWERPGHRSTSCLERKHHCKLSKELKMENSTQLSCEGKEGNSSWLGPGWDWVSWPSHLTSLCLSFPLAGWDTSVHLPSFGGPSPELGPLQSSQAGCWLRLVALATDIQRGYTPCLPIWPAGASGFQDSKFGLLSRQWVLQASPRSWPSLKELQQVTSLSWDLLAEHLLWQRGPRMAVLSFPVASGPVMSEKAVLDRGTVPRCDQASHKRRTAMM